MAPTTPSGPPSEVRAGDTIIWREADFADYPNSEGWSLRYSVVGVEVLQTTGAFQSSGADANHHLVTITAAQSAKLDAGLYRLVGRVVGSGTYANREETVYAGPLNVLADARAAGAGELQSHAERMLAKVRTVIDARLTGGAIESYSIEGRSASRIPLIDLLRLEARYLDAVTREKRGGAIGIDHAVVFRRPATVGQSRDAWLRD